MGNLIETVGSTLSVLATMPQERKAYRQILSPKTLAALKVGINVNFPDEQSLLDSNLLGPITDLLYTANNHFDVGLLALSGAYRNSSYATIPLFEVHRYTKEQMDITRKQLNELRPSRKGLVDAYVHDGTVLSNLRDSMSPVLYRELDSAIAAVLIFGFGDHILEECGINGTTQCNSVAELETKYKLFCLSETAKDGNNLEGLNSTQVKVVGMQALEMVLACLDDISGKKEDVLLKTPTTLVDGKLNINLARFYRNIAIKCGNSPLTVDISSAASLAHIITSARGRRDVAPMELDRLTRCNALNERYSLREVLNARGILSQMTEYI